MKYILPSLLTATIIASGSMALAASNNNAPATETSAAKTEAAPKLSAREIINIKKECKLEHEKDKASFKECVKSRINSPETTPTPAAEPATPAAQAAPAEPNTTAPAEPAAPSN